jgi:polar amino acid transport system substrate-binding protein
VKNVKLASLAGAAIAGLLLSACAPDQQAAGSAGTSAAPSGTFSVSVNAEARALLPETLQKGNVVRVATAPGYEPYEFKNDAGQLVGLDLDLGKALGDSLGVTFEFQETSFDSITGGIQSGRYDASLTGYVVRTERQEKVDLIDYAQSQLAILVAKGNPNGITGQSSLCGLRVGVEKGASGDLAIQDFIASNKCGDKKPDLQAFPLQADAVTALQSNRVDAVVGQSVSVQYVAEANAPTKGLFELVNDDVFPAVTVGIAVDKNQPGLRDGIALALKGLQEDGTFKAIFDKYGVGSAALSGAGINSAK